jgi:FixJ family two-component response regulator
VLAGESDVATAVGAIRAGAVDFIQKPVIDRILLRRVRDALEHAGAEHADYRSRITFPVTQVNAGVTL